MNLSQPFAVLSPGLHGRVLAVLARTGRPLTGRTIASLVRPSASPSGVQRVLDHLATSGLVDSSTAGRSHLYLLNHDHLAAPAVRQLAGIRDQLLSRIGEAARAWTPPALSVSLFGSTARGEGDADSDIDLFVARPDTVDPEDAGWREQLDSLAERVERWTGNDCRVLEMSGPELDAAAMAEERITDELVRDGITLAGMPLQQLIKARTTA